MVTLENYAHFFRLLHRLTISLFLLTLTRLFFYFLNQSAFPKAGLIDFFSGIWFDAVTIGIWFIPFYTLSLLPNPWRETKTFQKLLVSLFLIINSILIAFNFLDIEYFKYTGKRSTADLFTLIQTGNDINQLLTVFLIDYWWIIALFIGAIILSYYLYKRTIPSPTLPKDRSVKFWRNEIVTFLIGCSFLVIISRGGFGFRPTGMMTAAQFTTIENIPLVTNTPLALIKTIGKPSLQAKNYFLDSEKERIYTPIKTAKGEHQLSNNVNVFIIILESFGDEWLGKKRGTPFTPFLDSLINESLYFSNGLANGKKSMEAMPAIFASLPSLSETPYITSAYGTNKVNGLPRLLKTMGYSSAFFHGATNGSMKFDKFSALVGFDAYYGRTEYDNEEHFDGYWGIMDEYFNPWVAQKVSSDLNEPFIAGLFTLSSHHPYYVPKEYQSILPKGDHPIAQAIAYADMSLKLFFEQAKKEPWFENTLFVICADHTPATTKSRFKNRLGLYEVPILFFDPQKRIQPEESSTIFSQIDIYPSILDLVGYKGDYYAFGNSFKDTIPEKWSINYLTNTYTFYTNTYLLDFIDDQPVNLYNYSQDPNLKNDLIEIFPGIKKRITNQLKGVVQRYNNDLITNQLTPKDD